jgi:aryl carrier-like protein
MIPQHILSVSEFPVTPNGKVDRKRLSYPDYNGIGSVSNTAPATELEEKIVAIWKEMLGTTEIGIHDDFFDLGGHSILAIKVLTRLRKEIEPALTLRQVFENPTIEQIARKVEALVLIRDTAKNNKILDDTNREVTVF